MTAVHSGRQLLAHALPAFVAAVAALLSSCGGDTIPGPGTPVVTFSATNAEFVSYIVSIDSITLTGADGTYATPLVSPEAVDLAKLSDLGELVEAPAVPSDSYTSATLTLDYSTAAIWVRNANGTPQLMSPALPGGAGVLTAAITITFDPAHPLVVTLGKASRLAINFDLDAFNSVDLSTATVTVNPYVVMSQPPLDKTPLRARGLFVYTGSNFFVMNLRPFFDLVSALGAVTVYVSNTTYYNINGVTYTGAAGLAAMKSSLINTSVAVYGNISNLEGITPAFNATTVLVGSSLEEQGIQDHLIGVVTARSGNTFTVRDADYLYSTAACTFYVTPGQTYFLSTATVTIAANTIVSRDGYSGSGLSTQSISPGQVIDVGGTSSCPTNSPDVTLEAGDGQVRLTNTRAWGVLSAATPNDLTLDLITLGDTVRSDFNFAGTASGGGAVDPLAYPVDSSALDFSGAPLGSLVAVDGVANTFGSAPPAFIATAAQLGSATQQVLVIEWINGGSTAPFNTITPTQLIANLNDPNLGTLHAIYTGPEALDLKSLPASPIITTVGANAADLVLSVGNNTLTTGVSEYLSGAAFSAALLKTFDGEQKIFRVVAVGQYNSASNTFVASRINVSLSN